MSDQTEQRPPEAPKKPEGERGKSFFTTLPGILTALTGLIVAISGLLAALNNMGLFQARATETLPPTLTFTPTLTLLSSSSLTSMPSETQAPVTTQIPTVSAITAIPITPSAITDTPAPVTPTPAPTQTPPAITIQTMDFCVKPSLMDRVIVREGPDTSTRILGTLAGDACLTFDTRMPDNSWVRIAQEQSNGAEHPMAHGWVKSNLLSEVEEVLYLDWYISENARQGLYCVRMLEGLYVRECADTSCPQSGVLRLGDCLYFDGRLENLPWLRIAENQTEGKYAPLAHKWLSTEGLTLILMDFKSFIHQPDMKPYIELLPILTPPPTPGG